MGSQDYGWALDRIKDGRKVAREGWNGKEMYIRLRPGKPEAIPPLQPYIEMMTVQGSLVPWLCSQTDGLAEDWVLVG